MHSLRVLYDELPDLLARRQLLRPRGDRQRAPVHLRQQRRGRRRTTGDPQRGRRGVALPDDVQLHGILPAGHRGDQGDPGSQARVDVRALRLRVRQTAPAAYARGTPLLRWLFWPKPSPASSNQLTSLRWGKHLSTSSSVRPTASRTGPTVTYRCRRTASTRSGNPTDWSTSAWLERASQ